MDNKKEFLSTINHEIRTPLTSIKGFAETILSSYDKLSDEQKKKFINIIKEQSIRLISLVENALNAADSDVDYNNLVFKKTDINEILLKSIDVVKVNYKNFIFEKNLSNGLFSSLDKDALEQIFINILDNACKYSNNSNKVEIKTYVKDNKNYISIKNFGEIIEDCEKEKIFDKFYRTQTYLTSKVQGSGLGLFIVKTLISKMNGEIQVNSNKKEKSVEFLIGFPVFILEDFTKLSHKNLKRSQNV